MFAPPKRNGRPCSDSCVPERVTKAPEAPFAAPDGSASRARAASTNRAVLMRAFLAMVLAGVAAAVAAAVLGSPGVAFDAHVSDRLVLTTPVYRLAIAKRNGKLLELVD